MSLHEAPGKCDLRKDSFCPLWCKIRLAVTGIVISFWDANKAIKGKKRNHPSHLNGRPYYSLPVRKRRKSKALWYLIKKKELLNPGYTKGFQVRIPISVWIWIECIMNIIYRKRDWLSAWSRVPFHSLLSFTGFHCRCCDSILVFPSTEPPVWVILANFWTRLCSCILAWLLQVIFIFVTFSNIWLPSGAAALGVVGEILQSCQTQQFKSYIWGCTVLFIHP